MADKHDKTEAPTPKRKAKARKQGQVARSRDLVGWLGVLLATYLLPSTVSRGSSMGRELIAQVRQVALDPSPEKMLSTTNGALLGVISLLGPLLAGIVLLVIVGNIAQAGLILSTHQLKPSFKRLNPIAGFKRLFSTKNLWELLKNVAKLAIVAGVAYPSIRGLTSVVALDRTTPFWEMAGRIATRAISLVRTIAYVALLVALADFIYQKRSIAKSLKMSKAEVRDEAKQAEGAQEVKGKIKAKAREISRNRMFSAVANANVVVVNPIHIAVALVYDPMRGAPVVVAKGEGWVAERIRSEAEKHQVPIVESIPLARALYATVDLNDEIGLEFYEPVARLLAFVHRLGKRRPIGGSHHRLPSHLEMAGATG